MKTVAHVEARNPDRTMTLTEFEEWQQREHDHMVAEFKAQLGEFFDGYTDAQMEADFNEFCAALIKSAEEGFAQAQADLDRQRGETGG